MAKSALLAGGPAFLTDCQLWKIAFGVGLAVLQLFFWWPAAVLGQAPSSPFFNLGPKSTVEYKGILLCYRHDIAPSPENRARCEQEGHLPLFKRADGHLLKLMGSTNSITVRLSSDELHGKKVRIKGIYYPQTDHVLVEEVTLVEP